MRTRFSFWASRPLLPVAWLALLLTNAGDVESNPDPTTQTNTLQSYGCVTFVINKQQPSIRCNHTHWVHLKCTQIKQQQYKPDWRCTIHTPTQTVTTPSSGNTTAHHQQITTHPLTNNSQPKDKNIVILQININGIRNKFEELKKLVHTTHPDIITNMKHIHTTIVNTYLNNRQHNKITNTIPLTLHHSETTLSRATRHTLAQLRPNKCPILRSNLNKIDQDKHHHHYSVFANQNHTQHTCSTAPTQTHNERSRICGRLLWRWGTCWLNGGGHQRARMPTRWGGMPSAGVRRNGCWTDLHMEEAYSSKAGLLTAL